MRRSSKQRRDAGEAARLGPLLGGRPQTRARRRVRTAFEQEAHDLLVAEEGREYERREAVRALRRCVRARVEQHTRNVRVAARGGAHQRRLAPAQTRVRERARREQRRDARGVARFGRFGERARGGGFGAVGRAKGAAAVRSGRFVRACVVGLRHFPVLFGRRAVVECFGGPRGSL